MNFIIGAILNRWRGSGKDGKVFWLNYLIKSKTPKLIIMAIAYGIFVYLQEKSITISLLSAVWFGFWFTIGWGLAFAMGHEGSMDKLRAKKWYYRWWVYYFGVNDENWTYQEKCFRDYIFMTMRGLFITAGVGMLTLSPLVAISGGSMGLIYYTGWYIGKMINWDSIAVSELLFGGVIFMALRIL